MELLSSSQTPSWLELGKEEQGVVRLFLCLPAVGNGLLIKYSFLWVGVRISLLLRMFYIS